MSTESITNFAEQEAAAMKKNKEMFMALYRDGGWLYGLKVQNPRQLPEPVPLEALHLDYPPQSWRWLDSINADGLAEIAAAQGVKL